MRSAMPAGFCLALTIACGPQAGSGDGSGDGGESDGAGSEPASGDEQDDDAGPTTAPADTGGVDETCASADPAACPEGCARGLALHVIDDACGITSIEVCIPGGPKPGVPPTSYWAIGPMGAPVFVEYGGECGVGAQPETWTECSGAADEPADCACFCQQGYCRGDEDRGALDECGLSSPCDAVAVDPKNGAANHDAEQCVLESLRDRVPGVYELVETGSFSGTLTRFYVFGDEVARIVLTADDIIECPKVSDWSSADRCTLQPSEYFASCLEPTPGMYCVNALDTWVLDCAAEPPACE